MKNKFSAAVKKSIEPVSYTHLVRLVGTATGIGAVTHPASLGGAGSGLGSFDSLGSLSSLLLFTQSLLLLLLLLSLPLLDASLFHTPVSYTHLDVYKRQTLNRPGEVEVRAIPRQLFIEVWNQAQERPDGFMGMFY